MLFTSVVSDFLQTLAKKTVTKEQLRCFREVLKSKLKITIWPAKEWLYKELACGAPAQLLEKSKRKSISSSKNFLTGL